MENENIIKINGHNYNFEPDETILEVARRNGIDIPTLCHLKGTTPTGACRICIVEVKGARGPVASCSTPATPNMEVLTETPRIVSARKTVIELLLISGNHNCAIRGEQPQEWTDYQQEVENYDGADDICVAYGQCELQALAYKYMVNETKMDRIPTNYPLEYDNPLIGRDFSRCILCGRCVQACNEVQVNKAISYGYRGNVVKIVVKGDETISTSDCVFCGECIQACPVGALFEKKNRFKTRMWDVEHVRTTCHYCGVGCQLDLQINDQKIVKVEGVEGADPNLGRLCFKGRFAYDFVHSEKRLTKPMIKKNGKHVEASWDEALNLIVSKLNETKKKHGPDSIGCLVSTKYTNEDIFNAHKFFNDTLGVNNIYHFEPPAFIGISYEDIKKASTIVTAGIDIINANPVAATFVKQAALNGAKLIVVDSKDYEISKFAKVELDNLSGLEKEIGGEDAVLIHDPQYDVSSVSKINNLKICSLSKENNTLGAYFMGIKPKDDFNQSKIKFLYSMGGATVNSQSIDFLVVQDIFLGEAAKKADVILPAAVWVEYDGTYISSDCRVNRVRKAIDPAGEAKPAWLIFKELAGKMGNDWKPQDSKEIWEQEIIPKRPYLENIDYILLENGGGKISEKHDISLTGVCTAPKDYIRPDYQRILCEHSAGLEDVVKSLL